VRLNIALCALGIGAAACASAGTSTRPAPETLAQSLSREVAAIGGIPWSDRPLSWDLFKGPVPAAAGDRGAETAYSLFHAVRCTGARFEFRVVTAMLPAKSWVAPQVVQDAALSTRTLQHEQSHFDLSEVHARRLRRHFSGLLQPCSRTDEDFDELAAPFLQQEAAAHRRYDDETGNGRQVERQRSWDADIARQLLSLAQYGDNER
jgi:hypothetical protein